MTKKRRPYTDWKGAAESFETASDDFKSIGPTQKSLHTRGKKFTMGTISRRKKEKKK